MTSNRQYFEYKSYEAIRKKYFPRVLRDINYDPKKPKKIRVLDIGCAYGYFLKLCDKLGWETYGVDINEEAIKRAKEITKAKLFIHNVNKGLPMFSDNSFDLVTMFDVIEHLEAPYLVLKEVHRVLKHGGRIIITTPNLNALARYLLKILRKEDDWHGFRDKTHLYLFNPLSLKLLIERAGFRVVKLETPFHPLPKVLQRIVNKTGLGGEIWIVGVK